MFYNRGNSFQVTYSICLLRFCSDCSIRVSRFFMQNVIIAVAQFLQSKSCSFYARLHSTYYDDYDDYNWRE